METYKEGNQHLNELFNAARQEKPLLKVDEVNSMLPSGAPAAGMHAAKGFHFGISHIIVVSGIVISSGLAYVTMKTDKNAAHQPKTEQVIQTSPAAIETPKQESSQLTIKPKSSDKTNTLLASTDKKLISLPEDKHKKVALNEEYTPSEKISQTVTFPHDGKNYRIVTSGSDVNNIIISSVQVDDINIPVEDYSLHTDAIERAKQAAQAKIKEEGDKRYTINTFDKTIRADKLAADENHYVFQLTSDQLFVDGVPQRKEAFEYYSKLYKELTEKEIPRGSEYKFTMSRKQLETKTVFGNTYKSD
jgi:hypothetical protein